jgi:hypothetical protein
MDILNDLNKLMELINLQYLIVFMLLSYGAKNMIAELLPKMNKTVIVFIIGTVLALPFWVYFKADKMQLLITYAIGTSLHELIIAWIIKKAKNLFSKD